jgi:hypothetical protein
VKDLDVSFTKWPEILGKRLDVPVTNLARCGNDNGTIFDETIDHILEHKPWMVVIGITEIPRFRMYGNANLQCLPGWQMKHAQWLKDMSRDTTHEQLLEPWLEWFWSKNHDLRKDSQLFESMCDDHWKRIIRMQKLCAKLGIKLIMTHMVDPVSWYVYFQRTPRNLGLECNTKFEHMQDRMMTPSFYDVDDKSIIGWPHMSNLNEGFHILDGNKPNDHLNWSADCFLHVDDTHPSAIGHQLIAEHFYEHYQNSY